jgi:hypothetical protein
MMDLAASDSEPGWDYCAAPYTRPRKDLLLQEVDRVGPLIGCPNCHQRHTSQDRLNLLQIWCGLASHIGCCLTWGRSLGRRCGLLLSVLAWRSFV